MQKTRPAYAAAFRNQIIKLARAGRSVEDLAREFEPSGHTIRKWLRDAGVYDAGGGSVLDLADREELDRLRKEVRQLRQDRDILSKAAAWFAQNGGTSRKSTRS